MNQFLPAVRVTRSGITESLHYAAIAVVAPSGEVIWSHGDALVTIFSRSTLKPFQSVPVITSGAYQTFGITPPELALACGSHPGSPEHVRVAASLLQKAGIPSTALKCGTHFPPFYNRDGWRHLAPRPQLAIHNNCSGKHAGMLAACASASYQQSTYLDVDHPLQVKIREILVGCCNLKAGELQIGIDGCGAPNYALPLAALAAGYAKIAQAYSSSIPSDPLHIIARSMAENPFYVGGEDSAELTLARWAVEPIIAKGGAEGVFCMALPHLSLGVAIKVMDGTARAVVPIAVTCLDILKLASPRDATTTRALTHPVIKNCLGDPVGQLEPCLRSTG